MYEKKQGVGTKRERQENSDNVNDGVETFWTFCPYCYYIFEYEIVYHDYCLRCQNCKRAFHAVAINGPPPQSVLVEGKEQYNVCLGLFKMYYSEEAVAVANDKEKEVGGNSGTTVVYKTEDLIDAGSNNIQRRRVIANQKGTSGHLNIEKFREKLLEQSGTIDEDDRANQEVKQSQSRTGGELSNAQMVRTGEIMRGGIENKRGSMADHLENGLNEGFVHERECKPGELEFYVGDDDIYVGLADL